MQLKVVIERITYQNPSNGYCVLRTRVKGHDTPVTIVGTLSHVSVGSVLLVTGNWKNSSKYGEQFAVTEYEEELPSTAYGIEKYLGSGLIKGVGPRTAKKIVDKFGEETIDIIDHDITRLMEIPGLSAEKIFAISDTWKKQKGVRDIMQFLRKYDVSTTMAAKIYRAYGQYSIDKINDNPYAMADDIEGIGFRTADTIAEKMGYAKEDKRRIRAGVFYSLNQLAREGHVYGTERQICKLACKLLDVDENILKPVLYDMEEHGDVVKEDDAIYLPAFHIAEKKVAERLAALIDDSEDANKPQIWHQEIHWDILEKETGTTYDETQKAAIQTALGSRVLVVTGGPGTGKTTTTNGIIKAFQTKAQKILLAAPTGRAAKRLSESTGMTVGTIHRLLEYKPAVGYKRNEDHPLQGDVLILDEASMIDLLLMYHLLQAMPSSMRLILVGDVDQLPSVGVGNVLRDIISSGTVPVVKLTHIFRQAQCSKIVLNAHAINKGIVPELTDTKDSDFVFIEKENPEDIVSLISDLVAETLPSSGIPTDCIQVLTPMQKGDLGYANLNNVLQKHLNHTSMSLSYASTNFKEGDRVMQITNDYEKDVFNGDIGVIDRILWDDRELRVDFGDKIVSYAKDELDELQLAYAITIHKSQGSEYPVVIIPVSMKHRVMLQRNLIYTAITRAKKRCIIIGQKEAVVYAVNNVTIDKRNGKLSERLKKSVDSISKE